MKKKIKIPKFQSGNLGIPKRKFGDVPNWYNPLTSSFEQDYFPKSEGVDDIYKEQRNTLNNLRNTYKTNNDLGIKQLIWDFENDFQDMLEKDSGFAETNTNLVNLNKAQKDLQNYKPLENVKLTPTEQKLSDNNSLHGIDISPNPMWDPVNNLDAFQLQGQQIANENSPYIEIGSNQTITSDSPYQVNQKPLNQTKIKREFGLNAKNYANLQMLNSGINAIGNLYNQGQQNQSIINQNPLSSMQFSNGRSNQSKYGYSFQKGGSKQNPPKVYTDIKQFEQAQRMYNDSLLLYTLSEKQRLKGTNNKENILFNKKGSDVLDENERRWYQDTRKQLKGKFFPDSEVTIKIQGEDDRKRPNSKENDYNNDEYFHPDIKPIKGYNWSTETGLTRLLESNDNFLYKKPVQPVVYQPQQKTNTQKPQTVNTIKGKVPNTIKPNLDKNYQYKSWKYHYGIDEDTHPVTNMKRLPMSNQDLGNSKITMQGQPILIQGMRLPQQGNIPFYGPGRTIIGYTDENRKFYPAQQYTGAVNNELNLQDKALLSNPELLKKYVQSIDTYKFQSGGFKWDNEDDEFLFGDDEEDTVNVAEQPRQNDEEVVNQELQQEVSQEESYINDALYAELLSPLKRSNYRIRQPYQSIDDTYATPSTNLSLGNQQNQVYQYLQNKGLSKEAIAGIMGNIQHESSFNPGILGDNGSSFGLFQHHADRKNKLLNYLKERGLPANSVQGQIDFALQENPSLINQLNQAKSPQQAADIWVRKFEKPANVDKQSQLRQRASLNYYQQGGLLNKPKVKQFLQDNGNPLLSQENGVRANYDPTSNTIHYDNETDLIPEFSHVVQKMAGNIGGNSVPPNQSTIMVDNNQNLEVYPVSRGNINIDAVNRDAGYLNEVRRFNVGDNKTVRKAFGSIYPQSYLNRLNDTNIYMIPGSAEFEAHQLIEPNLGSYLTYQQGGTKINYPKFNPTILQQKPIIENTNPIKRQPIIIDPRTGLPMSKQQADKIAFSQKANQRVDKIEVTKNRSIKDKVINVVSNPMTSVQQLINKQNVTGLGDRNVYDYAIDLVNPVTYAKAIKHTAENVIHPVKTIKKLGNDLLGSLEYVLNGTTNRNIGEGYGVILDGLVTAQALKSVRPGLNLIDKTYGVGKQLNKIEKEGLAQGLDKHTIRDNQMKVIGITSNQRQAYIPKISEFLNKHVYPYGYEGANGVSKLKETLNSIKGVKRLDNTLELIKRTEINPARQDAWNLYLGLPQKSNTFKLSKTAPINHNSYNKNTFNNMDIYSINKTPSNVLPSVINNSIALPKQLKHLEKDLAFLDEGLIIGRDADVMGGYNKRISDNGLDYNDIWDLEPEINISKNLQKLVGRNNTKFEKIIYPNGKPIKIPIKVDKFIGKPFLSHEVLPYTKDMYIQDIRKHLVQNYKNQIDKYGSGAVTDQMQDFTKRFNKLSKKKLGGINDNNGYLTSNLHNFTPKKVINSNHITTDQMAFPIVANGVPLYPNTGDYIFPTNKVVEKPMYQKGGVYYASNADIANLKQKNIKFRYV